MLVVSTYPLSPASANIIRQAVPVPRITHEDGRLDRRQRCTSKGLTGTSAERIVHDLSALGVSDQDDLGAGTPLVEGCDSPHDGLGALLLRVLVRNTAAVALSAAGWVDDGFLGGALVGLHDHVNEALGGAVTLGDCRLAGAEDVHGWAGLAFLDGAGRGHGG